MSDQPRPVVNASRVLGAVSLVAGGWPPFALEFGWIEWTASQIAAYGGFVGLVIGAIALALGIRVEKVVTPIESPQGVELVPLVPIADDGLDD